MTNILSLGIYGRIYALTMTPWNLNNCVLQDHIWPEYWAIYSEYCIMNSRFVADESTVPPPKLQTERKILTIGEAMSHRITIPVIKPPMTCHWNRKDYLTILLLALFDKLWLWYTPKISRKVQVKSLLQGFSRCLKALSSCRPWRNAERIRLVHKGFEG